LPPSRSWRQHPIAALPKVWVKAMQVEFVWVERVDDANATARATSTVAVATRTEQSPPASVAAQHAQ
jgi:hypothetical protein